MNPDPLERARELLRGVHASLAEMRGGELAWDSPAANFALIPIPAETIGVSPPEEGADWQTVYPLESDPSGAHDHSPGREPRSPAESSESRADGES